MVVMAARGAAKEVAKAAVAANTAAVRHGKARRPATAAAPVMPHPRPMGGLPATADRPATAGRGTAKGLRISVTRRPGASGAASSCRPPNVAMLSATTTAIASGLIFEVVTGDGY